MTTPGEETKIKARSSAFASCKTGVFIRKHSMRTTGQIEGKHLRKAVVILWIAVLVAFSFVQVMHTHAALSDPERGHCAVCLAMHSPAVITAPPVLTSIALLQTRLAIFEPEVRSSECCPFLYTRPPPSA